MSTYKQIGIIGMAVMGKNLALNIEQHGYSVSIFNRSPQKTDQIIAEHPGKKLFPYYSLKEFVNSLEIPHRILLMVEAGEATETIIKLLKPLLKKGDILINGGNTFYKDTIRHNSEFFKKGIYFIGAGISGGAEGALKGPAIMPGGQRKAYKLIAPILEKIAAHIDNEACVAYIGPDGAGHYVKMVHNGIEYGDMQLIAESYALMKNSLNLSNEQISDVFSKWNKGEMNCYLMDISKHILVKKDEQGNFLIDVILDKADSKGTGKWISQNSLDLGEPLSLITESVFARYLSSLKEQRMVASKILSGPKNIITFNEDRPTFIEKIRRALYMSKIISYTQGFSQLKSASNKNQWNLNYSTIAKIFRAGCIIRAHLLKKIVEAYSQDPELNNLLLSPYFKYIVNEYHQSLRDVVTYAMQNGIPVPALSSAISYYDGYRSALLPANLIQAQRDYFGAHTYKRIDKTGTFCTKWID
ncbi:NADP-dependent phosphogluconate dehydrogenase [Candidatus Curculioniphilus buchneri]|uniref:NADP-dependent phosphogluconate dehydrogenase n=1 Tax=Candidatus Curculioniphilus buchneri TaxID=690594 RepID=UPI00376EC6DF